MNLRFVTFLLFLAINTAAQTPAYLHYGVREGLPSNLVYYGMQDKQGLLWFGTDKGLACFDGTRFRTFGMKEGLPDPEVFNLMEDSEGRLWISNYRKKPCYRQNGRFFTERQDSLLAKMKVQMLFLWEFFEDEDRSVWLSGQTNDVFRFAEKRLETRNFPRGVVRLGRIDDQLFFFGLRHIFQQQANGELQLVGQPSGSLRQDVNPFVGLSISGNRVLYSFVDNLVLLEWQGDRFVEIDRRPSPIGRIFSDKSGRFWVCSLAEGAICFDNDQRNLSNPVHYFQGEKVTAMFEDRQGTFWFCTTDNGIYALPKNVAVNFTERNKLFSNNITALTRSSRGQLWVGDDEGNVYEFDRNEIVQIASFGSHDGYNRIRRIIPTPDGGRWLVTDEALYYEKGLLRQKINVNVSPKTALLQSGKLWFASSSNLSYVSEKTFTSHRIADGRFVALGEDSEGNIWAGDNDGVFCSKDSFRLDWGDRFPALKGRIVAIERAGKDSLWIVTPENSLMLASLDAGQIRSVKIVNEQLNTPIENIQSLFSESNGTLWLATNRGVFRLDRQWNVLHFDHHDGLADDDVNAVFVNADTLWVGTVGGLSRLILSENSDARGDFPTLIVSASYRTGKSIEAFHLLDSFSAERRLILSPDASLFQIKLAGLDYRSRGNLQYECVTTAALPNWRFWTFNNVFNWIGNKFREKSDTALVTSAELGFGVTMPSGCYKIRVIAITTTSIRSLQSDHLMVEMRPYWYNTVWFSLLIWGLIAYIIWSILRARSAFRKLDASVSELQLQALQTQMNPHFVGNSINAIQQFFYPPDPARASEYISLFNRLLRRTMQFSEQTFIPFEEELAYDRDYLEMVKLRFDDRFHFEITGAESVPPDTPFPSMLLQPILENATLHGLAPEGPSVLRLDFSFSGKKLICTVQDNGVGLREAQERQKSVGKERKSKGLEMLRQKVETLNRRYDLWLQLTLKDLSEEKPPARGTRAVIQFFPKKLPITSQISEKTRR